MRSPDGSDPEHARILAGRYGEEACHPRCYSSGRVRVRCRPAAATVAAMAGIIHATAEEHLASETWFSDETQRTVTRCATWVRQMLADTAGSVSKRDAVAHVAVELDLDGRDCHHEQLAACGDCLSSLAIELLRRLGLFTSQNEGGDLPTASEFLLAVCDQTLLTDEVLAAVLDRTPGGLQLLTQLGAEGLRDALADDGRFTDQQLGHARLRPLLDTPVDCRWLAACNRVLLAEDDAASEMLAAIAQARPTDDGYAIQALRRRSGTAYSWLPAPILVPSRSATVAAVRSYLGRSPDVSPQLTWDLLAALDSPPASRRHGNWAEVRDLVWTHVRDRCHRPAFDYPAEVNLQLLEQLLEVVVTADAVDAYPDLKPLLRGQLRRLPTGRPSAGTSREMTMPFATAVATVRRFAADAGHLPRHDDVDGQVRASIEVTTGGTFSQWVAKYGHVHRLSRPSRSRNEQLLDRLLAEAYHVPTAAEWTSLATFASAARIDCQLEVATGDLTGDRLQPATRRRVSDRVELFVEADGHGHFEPVERFKPLLEARDADRVKAAAILGRGRRAGQPATMFVAIHHQLLATATAGRQLQPDDLVQLVARAYARRRWWMFLRPVGCEQMRAFPGEEDGRTPVRMRIGDLSLSTGVEAFTL